MTNRNRNRSHVRDKILYCSISSSKSSNPPPLGSSCKGKRRYLTYGEKTAIRNEITAIEANGSSPHEIALKKQELANNFEITLPGLCRVLSAKRIKKDLEILEYGVSLARKKVNTVDLKFDNELCNEIRNGMIVNNGKGISLAALKSTASRLATEKGIEFDPESESWLNHFADRYQIQITDESDSICMDYLFKRAIPTLPTTEDSDFVVQKRVAVLDGDTLGNEMNSIDDEFSRNVMDVAIDAIDSNDDDNVDHSVHDDCAVTATYNHEVAEKTIISTEERSYLVGCSELPIDGTISSFKPSPVENQNNSSYKYDGRILAPLAHNNRTTTKLEVIKTTIDEGSRVKKLLKTRKSNKENNKMQGNKVRKIDVQTETVQKQKRTSSSKQSLGTKRKPIERLKQRKQETVVDLYNDDSTQSTIDLTDTVKDNNAKLQVKWGLASWNSKIKLDVDQFIREHLQKAFPKTSYALKVRSPSELLKILGMVANNLPLFNHILFDNMNLSSVRTLYRHQWLNDEVVNWYMKLLLKGDDRYFLIRSDNFKAMHEARMAGNTEEISKLLFGRDGKQEVRNPYDLLRLLLEDPSRGKLLSDIFIPVNTNNVHWTLFRIDIKSWKAYYYDSLRSNDPERKTAESALKTLEIILEDIFHQKNITLADEIKDLPQQENYNDCGVFILAYTFQFSQQHDINIISQGQIEGFREAVCESFFTGTKGTFNFK